MKNLIRDLQRLNKPSSGKKRPTDIHLLIDHVLLFQKKHFSSNRIQLQTAFDHSLPEVQVIVDQITQVLFNLTMNAVDAMAGEGGVLTVTTRQQRKEIIIEVADTGCGIAHKHQKQIFEPFFSTKKEEDGTGLGLSISYGIARHHGGNLFDLRLRNLFGFRPGPLLRRKRRCNASSAKRRDMEKSAHIHTPM